MGESIPSAGLLVITRQTKRVILDEGKQKIKEQWVKQYLNDS